MTFVQITPRGVSFMSPCSLNLSDSTAWPAFPRLCQADWIWVSLHLAIQCMPPSPFTHTPTSHLGKDRGMANNKPQHSLTMQKVLEHLVQGQKSPLHNSIALKTPHATQYSDSKTGLIKISPGLYKKKNTESQSPWGNLEFVLRTRWFSHQVSLLNMDIIGTTHIKDYSQYCTELN